MIAPNLPWLIGGSADLAPSTMTLLDGNKDFGPSNFSGRNMHFGIREHGMAAALNGMALSGLRAFGATFFVFTDYLRPSMRLSSIMHQPVLYVLTHDSIGLGEDGPTHQPVEHLAACRAIPGLYVFRPGDANEVLECYRTSCRWITIQPRWFCPDKMFRHLTAPSLARLPEPRRVVTCSAIARVSRWSF